VSNANFLAGTALVNYNTLNVVGSSVFSTGNLDNRGTLVLGPANGFPGVNASISSGTNSGTLRVDGTQVSVSAYNLNNTGVISNEGSWYGSFLQHAGGQFNNAGTLTLNGSTTLLGVSSLVNSGTVVLEDGVLEIAAGAQISGSGRFVQQAGLARVNGHLQALGGIDIQGGLVQGTGTSEGPFIVGTAGRWKLGIRQAR